VTPPTIRVPYSRAALAWKRPVAPVIPWVITFVSLLTSMLIFLSPLYIFIHEQSKKPLHRKERKERKENQDQKKIRL
jgi:hypothetical protein